MKHKSLVQRTAQHETPDEGSQTESLESGGQSVENQREEPTLVPHPVQSSDQVSSTGQEARGDLTAESAEVPLVDTLGSSPSSEFPTLTLKEAQALQDANVSNERIREIAAIRTSKRAVQKSVKPELVKLFAEKKDWLLAQTGGKPLFSGKVAGQYLIKAGFYPPVRGFNAMGDKLGGHGHHLPCVVIGNVRHYDISYIGKSAAEKEARQAELTLMFSDVHRELMGAAEASNG